MVFGWCPLTVPTTSIVRVHDALGARLAAESWNCCPPAEPVTIPSSAEMQVPLAVMGSARASPEGRVSLNPVVTKLVAAFGLLSVKLIAIVPP